MPTTQGRIEAEPRAWLSAQEAGVKAARNGGIGSALDDGAAVGKKCDLVIVWPEFQYKIRVTNPAVGPKRTIERNEIHGTLAFVNLDRIPATQSDARPTLTAQMEEVTLAATKAFWLRHIGFHLRMTV